MNELPAPLVPIEVDLTDFQYMELDVRRLRDSRFAAAVSAEAFRAGVLLWCASWHQVPAGSIPDDDLELANLCGYGRFIKEWKKVREESLTGWIKCTDGRLYHPVVAEKALAAWRGKQEYAYDKLKERLRKENKRRTDEKLPLVGIPTFEQFINGEYLNGIPPENSGIPPESKRNSTDASAEFLDLSGGQTPENALRGKGNREGKGKGEGELNKTPKSSAEDLTIPGIAETECAAAPPEDEKLPETQGPTRAGSIAMYLLSKGIDTSSTRAEVIDFANDPRITDQVLDEAIAKAKAKKPNERIPSGFLRWAVEEILNPKAAKKTDPPWWLNEKTIEAKAREVGCWPARANESWPELKQRIETKIAATRELPV